MNHKKTYLALGDSYTIGESVHRRESFPYQLTEKLNDNSQSFSDPKIIAATGWTSSDLLGGITEADLTNQYDLVSLLIGVNNQYQGLSMDVFRVEFRKLLEIAECHCNTGKAGCVVISIPDWGATPFAEFRDRKKIAREIKQFNAICLKEAQSVCIPFVDITPVSKYAASDPGLTAGDGLHPSAKMYAEWVKLIMGRLGKI